MKPEMEALGRRAIACSKWRWESGMLCSLGRVARRVQVIAGDGIEFVAAFGEGLDCASVACVLPDFGDAPTRGALLELVREAWGPEAHLSQFVTNVFVPGSPIDTGPAVWWRVVGRLGQPLLDPRVEGTRYLAGPIEIEAMVVALEAAP